MKTGRYLINSRDMERFTIVELLVVIGIIGLLIAMVAPALQKAKKTGKRAVCISNLKQIGVSVQGYAQGNREFFPWNCTSQRLANPARTHIREMLELNSNVFECPDDDEGLYVRQGSSYLWNWMQIDLPGNSRFGQENYDTAPYGGLVGPAEFPVMPDVGAYHGLKGSLNAFNFLFGDMHVEEGGEMPF